MYKNFTKNHGRLKSYATKLLLAMKLTVVLCLMTILQVTAASSFGQKVTLNEKNVTIQDVIKKIGAQTAYDFFYKKGLLAGTDRITINVKNASLEDVLKECLKGLPLTFSINDQIVVIRKKEPELIKEPVTKTLFADSIITGRIIDAVSRKPIPGVTVTNKDKKITVQSSANGSFSIIGEKGSVLLFSYIGFTPREMVVTSVKNVMLVVLSESVNQMSDVVITGMFNRKAETYTGSTTTFKQDDLLKAGSQNVIQSIRNLEPAFAVIENLANGSNPNAIPNIQIRGQSGLPDLNGEYNSNPNLPLFILDGFETTLQKVIDLDVYRVSSVTILKDAASKSIYGSKGANGVVVIETLRPKSGELRVTYNTQIGVDVVDLSSYNLTNARQKLEVELKAGRYNGRNASSQLVLAQEYNDYLKAVEMGVNTEWHKKPVRNGFNQRHSFRVEGGDDKFTYGVDGMYNGISGTMKGSDRKLLNGSIDLKYRKKAFSVSNVLTIQNTKSNESPWGDFATYVDMNPYLAYTDENGQISKIANVSPVQTGNEASNIVFNPAYNATLKTLNKQRYLDLTNNTSLDWMITPSLRALGRFSITHQDNTSDVFLPADHTTFTAAEYLSETGLNRRGRYTKTDGEVNNIIGGLTLSYAKVIEKHAITLNSAYEMSSIQSSGNTFNVEGFPNERLDLPFLGLQYLQNSRPSGIDNLVRDMSVLASGNYAYDQKYLLDLSYRATQSSQYGKNNRWGQFWSAGLGWNLHAEKFIMDLNFINQFRLRASTGFTGSQGFNSFMSLATLTYFLDDSYMSQNGVYLLGLANPDLKWQRKQDHNFGADFTFFQRFSGSFDYYISNTDGTLSDITLPPSAGFGTFKANLGKVENKGFDLRLRYSVFADPATRSSLNVFGSLSHNKNTLKQISNSLRSFNDRQDAISRDINNPSANLPQIRFVEGQSMDAIYAVPSLGIDPATGREVYRKRDGSSTYDWDTNDMVVVGNSLPDFSSNFGFNLQYKNFIVNATCRYIFGGQTYNTTLVNRVENANIYQNVDLRVLSDRWQKPGDKAFFKAINNSVSTLATSRFVEDNNQLTLASVQFQYELDRIANIKKLGFSRLRVGLLSNETFVLSTVKIERGTSYPFARQFQFTLNANF